MAQSNFPIYCEGPAGINHGLADARRDAWDVLAAMPNRNGVTNSRRAS